ncbi:MAG: hypothetical protein WCJ19_00680 [bacterium]
MNSLINTLKHPYILFTTGFILLLLIIREYGFILLFTFIVYIVVNYINRKFIRNSLLILLAILFIGSFSRLFLISNIKASEKTSYIDKYSTTISQINDLQKKQILNEIKTQFDVQNEINIKAEKVSINKQTVFNPVTDVNTTKSKNIQNNESSLNNQKNFGNNDNKDNKSFNNTKKNNRKIN